MPFRGCQDHNGTQTDNACMKTSSIKKYESDNQTAGVTMIELGMVLAVIGLILFAAIGAWRSVVESRQIASTTSVMQQAKNCLVERMVHSLHYPTYSSDLQTDQQDPAQCISHDPQKDVDACLCRPGIRDAWGNRLRFVEGITEDGNSLHGEYAVDSPYRETEAVEPVYYSSAFTEAGEKKGIAFILVSPGPDGLLDEQVWPDNCFDNQDSITGSLADCTPDFTKRNDDQFLIVTGHELRAILSD